MSGIHQGSVLGLVLFNIFLFLGVIGFIFLIGAGMCHVLDLGER